MGTKVTDKEGKIAIFGIILVDWQTQRENEVRFDNIKLFRKEYLRNQAITYIIVESHNFANPINLTGISKSS